jgi:beta-1,4-mannosyl-glycoprotein beta-1,4-N-acetylglucosaminyltransferase
VKIIDTFPFNKDFAALEIRLNELWNLVDKFVISESSYSHSGEAKPLFLKNDKNILKNYGEKIILISDLKKLKTTNARVRESYQRSLIDAEINKMNLDLYDLVIHSDCDEIPRAKTLEQLSSNGMSGRYLLELDNYSFYINAYAGKWNRCTVTSYNQFKGVAFARQNIFVSEARRSQRINLPIMRVPDFFTTKRNFLRHLPIIKYDPKLIFIQNAGWHFNNLMPIEDLIQKVRHSSHTELRNENRLNITYVTILRELAKDLYSEEELKKVQIDSNYPEYVIKNINKFRDYIWN